MFVHQVAVFALTLSLVPALDARCPHVRTTSRVVAAALREGYRRSATLRDRLDRLARSDVIVHVAPWWPSCSRIAGRTRFVTAAGGHRFVRVDVDAGLTGPALIGLLAHELQHAVEVADDASARDTRSFAVLFRRIGRRVCGARDCYDTDAAAETGLRARLELRRPEFANPSSARHAVVMPARHDESNGEATGAR
jgi:hypothetical protein